jgi:dipeptidyl aminopeptidase/acylaminoacyl peptidase
MLYPAKRAYRFLIGSLLLIACAQCIATAEQRRPLTLDDMLAMKRISTPALSPDDRQVAYTVTTPNKEANRNLSDIWLTSIDGRTSRQLTTHQAADRSPVWSPDGKWIAFESTRSGENEIWLISPYGGEPRQFTFISTGASQAVWSPDGSMLAYVSEVFPEFSDRPFVESDALNAGKLKERESGPVKAQLFTRLLYRHWDHWVEGKRQHIFVQPLGGGDPRDLTPGDRDAVPSSSTFAAGNEFAFSPDGSEIAYTVTPLPVRSEAWSTNHDIYTVPVAGGTPHQLTVNQAADGCPRYSPDGRWLAYRAQKLAGYEADRWQLMLYDRQSATSRSLTAQFDASVGEPVWSPNSTTLYFEADEKGTTPVFSVALAGGVHKIIDGENNHDISIAADGRTIILTRSHSARPAEIYCAQADGSQLRRVTGMNDSLFATLEIPPPESVWYEGAAGAKVQAWLFKPPHFDARRKYPLVVMIHGGPQGAWGGWSYRWNPTLWAAQGYVVIAPNPRGSTGFGQQFTDEIRGDWGGKVFIDIMRGVDYAAALPFVDSTKMAAAGASFGGYMVNFMLGNTGNRFKAFVSHAGIYNFESMYGSTDEVWFDEWEHGGMPWEHPDEYRRFSPNVFAQNFRTPTLVIHGANDFRIPFTEAMQLFTALQRQQIPSQFLYFPDETHWVIKPANSVLWHETVFGWLAQYLHQ